MVINSRHGNGNVCNEDTLSLTTFEIHWALTIASPLDYGKADCGI